MSGREVPGKGQVAIPSSGDRELVLGEIRAWLGCSLPSLPIPLLQSRVRGWSLLGAGSLTPPS